jgi:hypothetical protein
MFQAGFATPQNGFVVKRFAAFDGDKTPQLHARRAPAAISRHDCRRRHASRSSDGVAPIRLRRELDRVAVLLDTDETCMRRDEHKIIAAVAQTACVRENCVEARRAGAAVIACLWQAPPALPTVIARLAVFAKASPAQHRKPGEALA